MIAVIGVLVALACVGASARRLWFVTHATAIHPDDVIAWLGAAPTKGDLEALRGALEGVKEADWERDLLEALAPERAEHRAALVNEQLTELDRRMQRWARVPAVCTRIATSSGFLLALSVLRQGLDAGELDADVAGLVLRGFVGDALTVIAVGVLGAAFCIGANAQARRLARARSEAADRMVDRLEAIRGTD